VRNPEKHRRHTVRMGTSRAVRLTPSRFIELYDLELDIGEQCNVADEYPKVVAKVERIFKRVRTDEKTWPLKDKKVTMPF